MGRSKDSVKEKKLRGTYRKDREPKPAAEMPKITDIHWCVSISGYKQLSKRGKAIYRQKCKEMIEGPGLYQPYLHALIRYSRYYDLWLTASENIENEGLECTYKDRMGNTRYYANPNIKVMNDAEKILKAITPGFGASPLDRQKIKVETATPELDALAAFMEQYDK